jgi:TolB protein
MPPCPRCGTPNEATRTFCKYCGERLTATTVVAQPQTRSRLAVDPRLAIGGGVVALAVVATIAFAAVLGGSKPTATPGPSLPTGAPSAPNTAGPPTLPPPSASEQPTATATEEPTASEEPTETPSPTDSESPTDSGATEQPTDTATATVPPPTSAVSVAFYAVRNNQADIFTIPPAGGKLTNITGDGPPDSDPKWSPDGRRIAFDSRRDGQRNIWIFEFDGSFNQLTHDTGANNAFPTWSPDGQHIAFVHDGEIWVMNSIDGRDAHALTAGADDSRPTWGENGQILFHRTTPGNHEIWTVPADGSADARVLIAIDAGGGRQPSWSPDGSKIAYTKVVSGVLRIVVADAEGGSQKVITPGSPCPCQFPTWSPDGKRIAFSGGTSKKEQIFVVAATGGTPKRITDGQGQNLAPGWGS